jgi:hypothetical protein
VTHSTNPRLFAQIQHRESCGDWFSGTGMARPSTRLQFLKGELVIAAKEVRQESEEVKQHGNHRIEIFFGSADRSSAWRSAGHLASDTGPSAFALGGSDVSSGQAGHGHSL